MYAYHHSLPTSTHAGGRAQPFYTVLVSDRQRMHRTYIAQENIHILDAPNYLLMGSEHPDVSTADSDRAPPTILFGSLC